MATDIEALEARVHTLERDRNGLEWLVTFLAARTLMREADPIAAAEQLQKEVQEYTQSLVNHALAKDSKAAVTIVQWASNSQILTDQIVEEVKISLSV